MGQTTIHLRMEETIIGAVVRPFLVRGLPTKPHYDAWKLFQKNADWHFGKEIVMTKEQDENPLKFYRELSERLSRIIRNRSFHTLAKDGKPCASGFPMEWTVTVFWNSPRRSLADKIFDALCELSEAETGYERNLAVRKYERVIARLAR